MLSSEKAWGWVVGWLAGMLALPSLALANGGDDHGAAVRTVDPGIDVHRVEVASSRFELVLRWPHADAGETLSFEAFISDFETNAPVDGAAVELRLAGAESPKLALRAAGRGRYVGEIASPSTGLYAMTMVVTLPDGGDVLVADGLELGPHADAAHGDEADHESSLPWGFWAGLGGVLLVGLVLLGLAASRARRASERAGHTTLALVLAGLLGLADTQAARAHGGDDHGAPATPGTTVAGAGGAVMLPKEAQNLLGLLTSKVERKTVTPRLTVTGMVTVPPGRDREILAPMNGTLEPVGELALGLRVEAGQVLYVMTVLPDAGERASLLAEQARERASLPGHQARVKQGQRALTRAKALNANDQAIAERDVEVAEAELAEAKSRLEASRAAIAALSSEGEGSALRLELKSPIAGEIAALHVTAGQVTADVPLVRIIDRSELLVAASVVETDLVRLSLNGRAEVRTAAGVMPARHVFTGPVVDPVKRTVDVLYALDPTGLPGSPDSPDSSGSPGSKAAMKGAAPLWLNQFVTLALPSGLAAMRLAVPEAALVDVDGRPVVWVKLSAETFAPVGVRVVAREGGLVAVEGELAVGDRVVTSGTSHLRGARAAGSK